MTAYVCVLIFKEGEVMFDVFDNQSEAEHAVEEIVPFPGVEELIAGLPVRLGRHGFPHSAAVVELETGGKNRHVHVIQIVRNGNEERESRGAEQR